MDCSICLNKIPEGFEAEVEDCHHFFCSECIFGWRTQSGTCPLCRGPINTLDMDPEKAKQFLVEVSLTEDQFKQLNQPIPWLELRMDKENLKKSEEMIHFTVWIPEWVTATNHESGVNYFFSLHPKIRSELIKDGFGFLKENTFHLIEELRRK